MVLAVALEASLLAALLLAELVVGCLRVADEKPHPHEHLDGGAHHDGLEERALV